MAAGCGEGGDSVEPSQSVTGRWKIPEVGGVASELELQEVGGDSLVGKLIILQGGRSIGEYPLFDGSAGGGHVSYRMDPLVPPIVPFIEILGNVGVLRVSGALESRETLLLDVDQDCATEICFEAGGAQTFARPMFDGEATVTRPFGRPGFIAMIVLRQDGNALSGSVQYFAGTTQGGTFLATLPVRQGAVTDTNVVSFLLDPMEAETTALAETLGCATPLRVFGRLDQGSTLRLTSRQVVDEDSTCSIGSFSFPGREVFDDFRQTIPAIVGGVAYDLTIATMQEGSVIEGTATFENDLVREGPFTIQNGRLSGGVVTFTVRPAEQESLALVRTLGSAAPIAFTLRIVGGRSAALGIAQECPCIRASIPISRIRLGL